MTRPSDSQEEHRKAALTAFLDARASEGYHIETRTDTHAIIAAAHKNRSLLDRLRKPRLEHRDRVVGEVGEVETSAAVLLAQSGEVHGAEGSPAAQPRRQGAQ